MGCGNVVNFDVFDAFFGQSACDGLRHNGRVAVHRSVDDDDTLLDGKAGPFVVKGDDLCRILAPDDAVNGQIMLIQTGKFLGRFAPGGCTPTMLACIVALPVRKVPVDFIVEDSAVECAVGAEGVLGEQGFALGS